MLIGTSDEHDANCDHEDRTGVFNDFRFEYGRESCGRL